MSFKQLLNKLKKSQTFKQFKQKNKKAFLFSAFFVLTPEFSIENQQIDFFIPEKKVVTFFIEDKKIKQKTEDFEPKGKITKLNENIKIDISNVVEIIKKEIKKQKLEAFKVNKVIAILQKHKNEQIWNITCLFSSFKILRLHIDSLSGNILENKQENMFDFIQVK